MSFSHVKHVLFEHNQRSFLSLKEELSPQLCQTHPGESIWGGAVWPFFPSSEKGGQSLAKPILHLNCAGPQGLMSEMPLLKAYVQSRVIIFQREFSMHEEFPFQWTSRANSSTQPFCRLVLAARKRESLTHSLRGHHQLVHLSV